MLLSHTPGAARVQTQRSTRRAFTLLEVLVVVAIIVMLAGVGGYYLIQRYEESKISRAKIDAEALSSQVETFKLNNGDYPNTIEALAQPQPGGGSALVPPDKIRDPWGKPYQIDPAGQRNGGNKADVFTTTPKGQIVGNFSGH
ncbi:MAG: type II secretion system protein GspG [Gemmataceae bacterium]